MKLSTIVGLLALMLFVIGCGGSGGSGGGGGEAGPLTGIWSGSLTRATDQLRFALTLTGNDVTGAATITRDGDTFIGEVIGTASGDSLTMNVVFEGLGAFTFTGTFTDTIFNGTYQENGGPEKTFALERQGDNTLVSVAGDYEGEWASTVANAGGDLLVTIAETENPNILEGSFSVTNAEIGESGTFTATIIGNKFTAGLAFGSGDFVITWSGTLSGNRISGPYHLFDELGGEELDRGTFSVDEVVN